ncbi:hypothetical protein Hanom_Chr01g00095041 [Helianthus anomalus]
MPTFTIIALQNLLEHRIPTKDSLSTLKLTNHEHDKEEDEQLTLTKRLNHIHISPALYTTPKPTRSVEQMNWWRVVCFMEGVKVKIVWWLKMMMMMIYRILNAIRFVFPA